LIDRLRLGSESENPGSRSEIEGKLGIGSPGSLMLSDRDGSASEKPGSRSEIEGRLGIGSPGSLIDRLRLGSESEKPGRWQSDPIRT